MFSASLWRGKPAGSRKSDKRTSGRWLLLVCVDVCLLIGVIVVVGYVVSVAVKVNSGYALTQQTATHMLRLQIIDGTDQENLARRVAQQLPGWLGDDMAVEIVEITWFGLEQIHQSFVVAREEDETASRLLAERLGLDPGQVVYQPLENNTLHVTTTLVLGEDCTEDMLAARSTEETKH